MRKIATTALWTALLLLIAATPAFAQKDVSGTVTDATSGDPLPGVNIRVAGTTTGTASDVNGQYSITVPGPDAELVFSYVGYNTKTVPVGTREQIDVALQQDVAALEELVVVGYGEQQAEDITGSVEKVEAEDFNQSAKVSPEQLIAAKVPGVQISSSSGAPGSQTFIRIRGATSVNADSQPLFVVDGVPISNEGTQATRNPLNFLNPNSIASITVLKDASATAIYGSRGANGVIIIETKTADEGEANITYSGNFTMSEPTDQIDVLNADQFRQVVRERAPSQLGLLGDATTNWQDAVQRTAYGQEHNVSVSRGYEDANYRLSIGYLDQQGVLQTSNTERLSVGLNYNQSLLDDQLSITANVKGAQTEDQFAPGLVGGAASFAPTQPIRDVNSAFGGFYEWSQPGLGLAENNPVAEFVLSSNIGTSYRSLGSVEANYKLPFVEGLSARAKVAYDVAAGEREYFAPTFLKGQAESANPGTVVRANFERLSTLFDAFLSYKNTFDSIDSKFDITAGYSWEDFQEEYPEFNASGLTTNIFGPNSVAPISDPVNLQGFVTEIPNRLISVFGRVNYTFMDRYLLTFTVRRDGSSRFGPENRWGTFPSGALAWRVNQESFFDAIPLPISTFKIRASWGVTGNQEIGDFLYAPLYVSGGPQAQVQFGDEFVTTIRPSAADEALKWEETTSTNIGLDYGFLDGRLTGSFNYYVKDTDDLLFTVPVAAGANLSNRLLTNIGSMRNEGYEFSIAGRVIDTEAFRYNAQFNVSTNENKLTKINRADDVEDFQGIDVGGISGGVGNTVQILQEGAAVNSFFLYQHKRDANGDPIYADVNGDGTINGDDLYKDINGDGAVTSQDRSVVGAPQPEWILGHTSQLSYNNFDLSFTLRAHIGQEVYNNIASNYGHFQRLTEFAPSNLHESALKYGFEEPLYLSDVYLEDGSFLRMDNITLGYTLTSIPTVDQIRVYGSVNNAFVLTGYSGRDPEVGGPGASAIGIDNNTYPRSRTFSAGINVRL